MAPIYRTVKSHDGHVELAEIKATCKKHEHLCRQFTDCCRELQQNDAQLEILGETATLLRSKHDRIKNHISERREKMNPETELSLLEEEIQIIQRQVMIWMKELEEINTSRLEIEIRFLKLMNELKKSVTCVQLASIDFELIQMRHKERWQRFLADHVPSGSLDGQTQL